MKQPKGAAGVYNEKIQVTSGTFLGIPLNRVAQLVLNDKKIILPLSLKRFGFLDGHFEF